MNDEKTFDHRPDPELGAALRRALDPPRGDQVAFVARVMARYDQALATSTVPTLEVLAAWARRGIAAALVAAVAGGFLLGRALQTSEPETFDATMATMAAMAPTSGAGVAALVTATDPPDASIVFASLVEQR
jgi:GNAT superfamily N-acetyltransferase